VAHMVPGGVWRYAYGARTATRARGTPSPTRPGVLRLRDDGVHRVGGCASPLVRGRCLGRLVRRPNARGPRRGVRVGCPCCDSLQGPAGRTPVGVGRVRALPARVRVWTPGEEAPPGVGRSACLVSAGHVPQRAVGRGCQWRGPVVTVAVHGFAGAVVRLLVVGAPPETRREGGAPTWCTRQTGVEEEHRHGSQGMPRCQSLPNKGVQPTGNSVRSCVAPALSSG
jgi:hypothetical protein